MKTAFSWCIKHRPEIDGVVTVDGDNQHLPRDVRRCAETMLADPEKIWLGVRDFSLEHVPWRSRFGNNLTRGIMRLACGVNVTDTQTGLRAIPDALVELFSGIEGERYEYEMTMRIECAHRKIPISEADAFGAC